MKVAVLLRGQPRFTEDGAKLFDLFMRKQHPDVEFKVFIHSWNTISKRMTSQGGDGKKVEREVSDVLEIPELLEMLSGWEPTRLDVGYDYFPFQLAKRILHKLTDQEGPTYDWYVEYMRGFGEDVSLTDHAIVFPEGATIKNTAELMYPSTEYSNILLSIGNREALRLTYLLGQIYSAGESLKVLEEYQQENPDYKPDMVISMRHDGIIWVHDFDTIYRQLMMSQRHTHTVLSRNITVVDTRCVPDDYVWIGTQKSISAFVSDPEKRLFNKLAGSRIKLFDLLDSGTTLQHVLWTKVADDTLTIAQPSTVLWDAEIIRPIGIDVDNLDGTYGSYMAVAREISTYTYPDPAVSTTDDELISIITRVNTPPLIGTDDEDSATS